MRDVQPAPNYPNIRQELLPPEPDLESKPKTAPKKASGRKKENTIEPEPTLGVRESIKEDLTNLGPLLVRSRQTHDNYNLTLKNDQTISFHRADWTNSAEDNFITFYRKTATSWEVMDISIDDISCISLSLKIAKSK